MKRASYRDAIAWIAANDSDGDPDRLDPEQVGLLVTSTLIADIFEVGREKVGRDVVRKRRNEAADTRPVDMKASSE
jgi:hypothetical protein